MSKPTAWEMLLERRVKQILEEDDDPTLVEDDIAEMLRDRFAEYRRQKQSFRFDANCSSSVSGWSWQARFLHAIGRSVHRLRESAMNETFKDSSSTPTASTNGAPSGAPPSVESAIPESTTDTAEATTHPTDGESLERDDVVRDDVVRSGHNLLNAALYGGRSARASPTPDSPVRSSRKRARDATPGAETAATSTPKEDGRARKRRRETSGKRKKSSRKSGSDEDDGREEDADEPVALDRPTARYADLGGVESILRDVQELVEYPLTHPEIYAHLGVDPPRGILLHGPPGCGKTLLAHAIAGELNVPFHKVSAPEIVSGMSGESEGKLRRLFEAAESGAPSLVFIDEIDAIAPKRESAGRGMERRIVAQLLTCMDNLGAAAQRGRPVLVIGATNRPDSLDAALRRSGRFDRELGLGIPDERARCRILERLTAKMRISGAIDLHDVARLTPGYVGADLAALTKEAAVIAVHRVFSSLFAEGSGAFGGDADADAEPTRTVPAVDDEQQNNSGTAVTTAPSTNESDAAPGPRPPTSRDNLAELEWFAKVNARLRSMGPLTEEQLEPLHVSEQDFQQALGKVQPSATREGFATVPNVSWDDIGALRSVRDELSLAILGPIRDPTPYETLGVSVPAGVLLYGPPGCGKTLLAKAIANESGANFISVKGPELLDKYVGESERAVRQVFTRARASAPCVVFFDELDALAPRRGGSDGVSGGVSERVVNQLLTELDGLESRKDVFVVAATNRPDIIDSAMLRPGRLDKLLYVPLPTPEDRAAILRTHVRHTPLDTDVDLHQIAIDARCDRFSGADLAGLVREAALEALRESLEKSTPAGHSAPSLCVAARHFARAVLKVRSSVSRADQRLYDRMQRELNQLRGHVQDDGGRGGNDAEGVAPPPAPVAPEGSS